jgi:hypothetical protein
LGHTEGYSKEELERLLVVNWGFYFTHANVKPMVLIWFKEYVSSLATGYSVEVKYSGMWKEVGTIIRMFFQFKNR